MRSKHPIYPGQFRTIVPVRRNFENPQKSIAHRTRHVSLFLAQFLENFIRKDHNNIIKLAFY